MSTKLKMLWKEWLASGNTQDEQAKRRRRYSLLLLLLLFIGFATYGTYSYFTTSTSLAKAKVKLDDGKSVQLGDGNGTVNSGDGTASAGQAVNTANPVLAGTATPQNNASSTNQTPTTNSTPQQSGIGTGYQQENQPTTPSDGGNANGGDNGSGDSGDNGGTTPDNPGTTPDDNGNTPTNPSNPDDTNNNNDNYKQFGEFDWVYVGNTMANVAPSLVDTFKLSSYNRYLVGTDGMTFNNVTGGDVFRKTVRLKVTGTSKEKIATVISWGHVANEALENITGALYVKKGQLTADGEAPAFSADGFQTAFASIPTDADASYTDEAISVSAGEYLDIELVVAVRNDAKIIQDVPLANILREITVTLTQNEGSILDRAFSNSDLSLEK